jgi:hypothetical protein
MTIALRQYKKVYNEALLELLKDGFVPSHEDIVLSAGTRLPTVGEEISSIFKFRQQSANSVFDIISNNISINDIDTDLTLLYEELLHLETLNTNKVLHADLFHSVHIHELNKMNKELDSLLFAIDGGEENFAAKFESFDDLTKTDQILSDNGVVDLSESALALPISLKGSFKIQLNHLSDATQELTVAPSDYIKSEIVSGTKYSNIFTDSILPWAHEILTVEDNGATIEFTFKLDKEEFINRITATHYGEKEQTLFIRTSVDNVNKKDLIGYSQGVTLEDQSHVVSFDFDDILVEFIHVSLNKTSADAIVDGEFQYIFGLKNISILSTGRQETATYFSKPFDFSESTSAIGKVSISASEELPIGTNIAWFIAVADSTSKLFGSYMSIAPINRASSSGPPKVISLSSSLGNQDKFSTATADYSIIESSNNVDFYNIFSGANSPVFGSALLYRGIDSWLRDQTKAVNPTLIKDNFIPFSNSDIQQLYQTKQETIFASKFGVDQTIAITSIDPLYDSSKAHTFIPNGGKDPGIDPEPLYAVYSANLASSNSSITLTGKDFSVGGIIDLGIKNIKYLAYGDIVIVDESDDKVYIDGYDYIVRLDDNGDPTGIIEALPASENDPGAAKILAGYDDGTMSDPPVLLYPTVSITYSIDPEVTRFITNIVGNQIFFDMNMDNLPGAQIMIKYRHKAIEVIKSSIKLKVAFGEAGNSKIFIQGKDYIYDSNTSSIQMLSTGEIASSDDVYADFKFNNLGDQLDQFFVWAFINEKDGASVITEKTIGSLSEENKLDPNQDKGEEFLAQIPGIGLVDLTNAVEWPKMKGWIQFIVKSVDPDVTQGSSGTPLIDQVIKMKDQAGDFIFIQDGKYIEELTAIKEPMTQVSFSHLKNNVLKSDDKFFSIKEVTVDGNTTYQTVVNFQPNTSSKLYSFSALGDGFTTQGPTGIYSVNESWRLESTSKDVSAGKFQKVIVKSILSRTPDASGGNITPKAFDYFIKIGN